MKVTNTGDVAGKDVVQLYVQTPYIEGGLEKASIQLLDFGKTEVLELANHRLWKLSSLRSIWQAMMKKL